MSLQYILGKSGSGKTKICFDEIINEMNKGHNKSLILIVPEQFTLETQKN